MSTRIALVQLRTPDTHAGALAHAAPLIREAKAGGAELILTPEGSNILQRDRDTLLPQLVETEEDPFVLGVQALAAELSTPILIGSAIVRRPEGGFANRALMVGADGHIKGRYDKIHMFDVDLPTGEKHRESAVYVPGDHAAVTQTPFGLMGITICYDVRFPALYRAEAKAGAVAIAVPAAFTCPTGEAHWEVLLRARAIETGSYVLAPAQGGVHADGRGTWGHSVAIGPWGEILGKLDHDEPGVLFAEIDPEQVAKARAAVPALANARGFSEP
jgi:predicted amidohydrolase